MLERSTLSHLKFPLISDNKDVAFYTARWDWKKISFFPFPLLSCFISIYIAQRLCVDGFSSREVLMKMFVAISSINYWMETNRLSLVRRTVSLTLFHLDNATINFYSLSQLARFLSLEFHSFQHFFPSFSSSSQLLTFFRSTGFYHQFIFGPKKLYV